MTKPANPAKMKLEDLSPAARAAVETKTITGGWDGRSLVKLFAELDRWDAMAEARKARARKVFFGGIIGSVIGFFALFIVGAVAENFFAGLLFFLVPLAVLIVGVRMKKAARAIDLPNELSASLRPVLKKLSQDLHPDEKIKVNLNLAGIDESKCANVKDLPPGHNRSLKQFTYDEELCDLRLPLTDGTQAVVRLENTYVKLERSYRTSRGKYKSKTKWKKLVTVTTILIPPQRINWEPARVQQTIDRNWEKVSFVEKDGVMAARMDRYYKFKAAGDIPADVAPAADVLRMLVRLTAMRPQAAGGVR